VSSTGLAYKFTRAGGRSPFTGFEWPFGDWVDVQGEIGLCASGIHACRVEALPRWVDDELWRIELDGIALEHEGLLVARRGRLVARVEEWNAETSRELARSCAAQVTALVETSEDELLRRRAEMIPAIADGPDPSATALAMYTTAHALDDVTPGTYWIERRRQAEWLRERLGLDDA